MKPISIYSIVVAAFLTFALFVSYIEDDPKPLNTQSKVAIPTVVDLPQIIKAVTLNKTFDFGGEILPTHENFDVRERLDQELLRNAYYHSNTILNIKKANRFFPVIEPILAKHGVPDDMKYLAVAESDLRNATSPAGAKGIWQFMKPTGKAAGLEINSGIDERYNLEKATEAACKKLKKDKREFGTWTLAAAAYNMGNTRLRKEIAAQRTKSYYDMNLNQETMKYVLRIVSIKEILSKPEQFGFYINQEDKYAPFDFVTTTVTKTIPNLGDFAIQNGTTYRMIKLLNPWLLGSSLPNSSGRTYKVKIPRR